MTSSPRRALLARAPKPSLPSGTKVSQLRRNTCLGDFSADARIDPQWSRGYAVDRSTEFSLLILVLCFHDGETLDGGHRPHYGQVGWIIPSIGLLAGRGFSHFFVEHAEKSTRYPNAGPFAATKAVEGNSWRARLVGDGWAVDPIGAIMQSIRASRGSPDGGAAPNDSRLPTV